MATMTLRHAPAARGRPHHATSADRALFTIVGAVAALMLAWVLAGALATALLDGPYLQSSGVAEAAPLGLFAIAMAVVFWMPLFMPALIPLCFVALVVVWAVRPLFRRRQAAAPRSHLRATRPAANHA